MAVNLIDLLNTNVSSFINKTDETYEVIIGKQDFIPEMIITESSDYNCGAICNELEYAKYETWKLVKALDIDTATGTELETVIKSVVNLPRRGELEEDSVYRKRFKCIVTEQTNRRRTTKWAILDGIRYFVQDDSLVQFVELFDTKSLYFQIRIEAVVSYEGIIFLGDMDDAFVNQGFLGGLGIGSVITYLGELISRIKASGVEFDILFIEQNRFTKTSNAVIGTVQLYKQSNAWVQRIESFTKTSNAMVSI